MKFLLYKDLTQEQKEQVEKRWGPRTQEWLDDRAFVVTKAGNIDKNAIPGYSPQGIKRMDREFLDMMNYNLVGPCNPEKGDIHHLKTCSFGLNKEK